LQSARLPVVVLNCDLAAANSALALAERLQAVADIGSGEAATRHEADAFHSKGGFWTSKREALARADTILIAGGRAANHPLAERLKRTRPPLTVSPARNVLSLVEMPGGGPDLKSRLLLLGALLKAKPAPAFAGAQFEQARGFAGKLKAAKFGAALWSAEELDNLDIAALMGIIGSLNETTRFTSLPLRDPGNGWGIAQLMLARWGVRPGARWLGSFAEHDTWRYSGRRLIEAHEADAVLAVSSFAGAAQAGHSPGTLIVLSPDQDARSARFIFETGASGLDYDAQFYDETEDAVISRKARAPSAKPTPASLLDALARRIGEPAR
jgi:hypothetical protein